ncbi:MAG: M23 family metallopeptidase, partial [Flavobacteriaceae bacterium]|nr:M23 family metallopeptidase [Flavobacteriaceae bacterium]
MRKPLYIICLLILQNTLGQSPYPQDYFNNPLDVPLILAGTFAELRSNHFHSGLDIKTQQREGLKVYASAHGYVSRIKISTFGYGKALYITHPNGYTTVYAHLQKFSPKIEAYIKKHQYAKESFEIELFPKIEDLLIESHEIVAFSGNTGGSAGPHLHYEIRDKQERPINPMLFGIDIKDSRSPRLLNVFVYPISDDAHVNQSKERQELRITKNNTGDYVVENINAYGKIGFGIVTYDQLDGAHNKNGVSNLQTFYNGTKKLEIDFKRFSFSETKHLNRLIDYGYYKSKKTRIQKLFIEPNNPLSIYKEQDANGYLFIEDNTASVYKIKINDYKNNAIWLTVNINGEVKDSLKPKKIKKTEYFVYADQAATLEENNVSVQISKNTFYDNLYLDFSVMNDTLKLGEDLIPLQKNMSINFDVNNYREEDKRQ